MIYTDKYSLIYPDSSFPSAPFYSVYPADFSTRLADYSTRLAASGRPAAYRIPPLYSGHHHHLDRRRWDRKF